MGDDSEQAATRDALQSSELTARLLRRADVSPGVLDTAVLRRILARLAGWVERPASLFDELMFRYRIDDDSIYADGALVMEQPRTANVNAYLTNSNSFFSTINQFFAGLAASRPGAATGANPSSGFERSGESHASSETTRTLRAGSPRPPASSSSAPSVGSSARVPNPDARTTPTGGGATHSPAMKFRVSRSQARRAREAAPDDASDAARSPVLKSTKPAEALSPVAPEGTRDEGAEDRPAKTAPAKTELTRVVKGGRPRADAPTVTPPGALPLALTQTTRSEIRRESADEGGSVSRQVSEADAMQEGRQPARAEEPPLTLTALASRGRVNPARDIRRTGASGEKLRLGGEGPVAGGAGQPDAASHPVFAQAETPNPVSAQAETPGGPPHETLPLARKRFDSSQARSRPPDFVWRKGADHPSVTDPTAGGNPPPPASQTAGQTSTFQSPQSQTVVGASAGRKDEPRAASEVTTERILRNLSRKLLVERERRGY